MIERINPFSFDAFGHYSQGIKIDLGTKSMIIVAGQLAIDEDSSPVAPSDIAAQTHFIFERIRTVLEASGATLDDVVKATFYFTDASKYQEISDVRNIYFDKARPASVMIEMGKSIVDGCNVEIEVMAMIDNP